MGGIARDFNPASAGRETKLEQGCLDLGTGIKGRDRT